MGRKTHSKYHCPWSIRWKSILIIKSVTKCSFPDTIVSTFYYLSNEMYLMFSETYSYLLNSVQLSFILLPGGGGGCFFENTM